eukprot:UN22633
MELQKQYVHELVCITQYISGNWKSEDKGYVRKTTQIGRGDPTLLSRSSGLDSHYFVQKTIHTIHKAFYFEEQISNMNYQAFDQVDVDYTMSTHNGNNYQMRVPNLEVPDVSCCSCGSCSL